MNALMKLALALTGALPLGAALAQPVQLSESEFQQQSAALPTTLENFNALPLGLLPSPLTLANGQFIGTPQIMNGLWCVLSPCMAVGVAAPAEFTAFPADTAFWSGRVLVATSGNVLEVTVVGNSGTQVFVQPAMAWAQSGVFLGFHDPRGLQSLRFRLIQGVSNYSFDEVRIAAGGTPVQSSAVPIDSPASTVTLGLFLLAFGLFAAGRSSSRHT